MMKTVGKVEEGVLAMTREAGAVPEVLAAGDGERMLREVGQVVPRGEGRQLLVLILGNVSSFLTLYEIRLIFYVQNIYSY